MNKILKVTVIQFVFVLIMIIVSCSKNEKNYTIKEVDGIKTFKNNNVPSNSNFNIKIKEILKIEGIKETNSKEESFLAPVSIDADKEGNIYVLDSKSSSVKKLSESGEFIKSFGSRGSGPDRSRPE